MHEDTVFSPTAFEDFTYWAQNDRKILGKIKALIAGIHRNGLMDGLGKPEKLLGQSGEFRRRITAEHRLVYRLNDDRLKILSCQDSVVPRTLPGQKNPRSKSGRIRLSGKTFCGATPSRDEIVSLKIILPTYRVPGRRYPSGRRY